MPVPHPLPNASTVESAGMSAAMMFAPDLVRQQDRRQRNQRNDDHDADH
jgi:hypothetical protein